MEESEGQRRKKAAMEEQRKPGGCVCAWKVA